MPPPESFARLLRDIVGPDHVVDDPGITERYRRDWTGRFDAPATLAVRPGSSAEVSEVVRTCRDHGVAIVPQGGNTGLVGGSVPLDGELVVSTERLSGIESVTAHAGVLTAGAGTTITEVHRGSRAAGWDYGVNLASRDSATLGGTIATNAGGTRVVRYGDTRRQVVGVEFVTGTGAIVSNIGGTLRDNTGFHLPSIVAGSEGTLGLVTRAALRLVPRLGHRTTALLRFADPRDAIESAEAVRGALPAVESVELFFAEGVALVCSSFGLPTPFPVVDGGYVLVEVAGSTDLTDELAAVVGSLPAVADAAVAEDPTAGARLWRYRELHTEAISTVGIPHKLDVAVPPGALSELVARVDGEITAVDPAARVWLFGHGGESALHVNITGVAPDDDRVDEAVLRLVVSLGGSISAEHGIGRAKRDWMEAAHDRSTIELFTRIKSAFDPDGIMNPAVLVPAGSHF